MKENFKKQKNMLLILLVIGTILVILGMGTVIATTSIVKKSSIGKEKAQNFAFVDAGVDPVKVIVLSNKFDFEDGQFVYEIEFVSEGIKYEYCVKASDGSIIEKEIDESGSTKKAEEKEQVANQSPEKNSSNTNTKKEDNQKTQTSAQTSSKTDNTIKSNKNESSKADKTNSKNITLEKAKNNALSNAGISSSKATFTKTKLDEEDGILVYEIEFYTQTHKYEYEINASTGTVHKKESKKLKTSSNTNNNNYIGISKAKSIALNHAKLSSSEVTFKKAKLDEEDNVMIYEIEFEKGHTEYEYEINALTGNIIKYEID